MESDYEDVIARARRSLVESGLAEADGIRGCSPTEIEAIERQRDVTLPPAYVEFLRVMGEECGEFLSGEEFLYPEMLTLTDRARRLVERKEMGFELPDSGFAFLTHREYLFLYFDTGDGESPTVYRVLDGEDAPERVSNSFARWLSGAVREEVDRRVETPDGISIPDLREAVEWVGAGPERFLDVSFDRDVDGHYRLWGTLEHEVGGLSDERRERLRAVRGELGLAVSERGETDDGSVVTLTDRDGPVDRPFGDLDESRTRVLVDLQVEILRTLLLEVYGVGLDEVEGIGRGSRGD